MTARPKTAPPSRTGLATAFALALGVAAGCGPDRPDVVPASGQVLIDGQPLPHGFVQVLPENARPATGPVKDGRFVLTTFEPGDGVVPGRHRVAVLASEAEGGTGQRWHAPKKYADPETSGLEIEVAEPTEDLRIELTWDGGKPFVERFQDEGTAP